MKTSLWLLLVPFLFACTEKKDLSSVDDLFSNEESIEGGTWISNCRLGTSSYDQRTNIFSAGQFIQRDEMYNNASCAGSLLRMDITGTYVVGDKLSTTSDSRKLDLTLGTLTLTAYDATIVSTYNLAV